MAEPVIRTNPYISGPVLDNRADAVICQSILRVKGMNAFGIKMVYAIVGSDPYTSVPGLGQTSHVVVDHTSTEIEMVNGRRCQVIQAIPIRSNPERPVSVAKDI